MDDSRPLVAGRYRMVELIGRGGMADVHRAHDEVLGRDVALKMLRDLSDVDAARFVTEAHLLARLNHPSVITVLDAGSNGDKPWLALELVSGRTLDVVLRDDRPDAAALAGLATQVADGLAHAHNLGIVHRDVKPSNVLVTQHGIAKIADFGIARLADASASLTLTGHTIGTAAYLSPEQVRGEEVSGRSDVYALGLTLLEALTGARAYPGPPVEAALARLHRSPLIPTSLPPGWSGLLASMTRDDPADRPSADAVAERLRSLASAVPADVGETSTAAIKVGEPASAQAAVRRRPRGRVLVAAGIVLLLATAVLGSRLGGDDTAAADQAAATTAPTSTATTGTTRTTASASPTPKPSAPASPAVTTAAVEPAADTPRQQPASHAPPKQRPGAHHPMKKPRTKHHAQHKPKKHKHKKHKKPKKH